MAVRYCQRWASVKDSNNATRENVQNNSKINMAVCNSQRWASLKNSNNDISDNVQNKHGCLLQPEVGFVKKQ